MTYLLIILLVPSPIPSQIPHTLFDIYNFTWCGCRLTPCPGYIYKTVHNCAHSKMSQHKIVNNVWYFPIVVSGQYVHRQDTIKTTVPLPHREACQRVAVNGSIRLATCLIISLKMLLQHVPHQTMVWHRAAVDGLIWQYTSQCSLHLYFHLLLNGKSPLFRLLEPIING